MNSQINNVWSCNYLEDKLSESQFFLTTLHYFFNHCIFELGYAYGFHSSPVLFLSFLFWATLKLLKY